MTKKKKNNKKKFEETSIDSNSTNDEIRRFFIDTAIKTINYMGNKAYNGRIRNDRHERIKIEQLNLIVRTCNVGNRILKDKQLDEYEKDMNALKNGFLIDVDNDDEVIELSPQAIKEVEKLDARLLKMKEENEK